MRETTAQRIEALEQQLGVQLKGSLGKRLTWLEGFLAAKRNGPRPARETGAAA